MNTEDAAFNIIVDRFKEVSRKHIAVVGLLINKGIITEEEYDQALAEVSGTWRIIEKESNN